MSEPPTTRSVKARHERDTMASHTTPVKMTMAQRVEERLWNHFGLVATVEAQPVPGAYYLTTWTADTVVFGFVCGGFSERGLDNVAASIADQLIAPKTSGHEYSQDGTLTDRPETLE